LGFFRWNIGLFGGNIELFCWNKGSIVKHRALLQTGKVKSHSETQDLLREYRALLRKYTAFLYLQIEKAKCGSEMVDLFAGTQGSFAEIQESFAET